MLYSQLGSSLKALELSARMTEGPSDVLTQASVQQEQVVGEAHKNGLLKIGNFWKEILFDHPQDTSTDRCGANPSWQ